MATDPVVIFGPGQCRECGSNLVVIDIESTILELGDDGSPYSENTIVRIKAKCPHCGREYAMFRDGLKYVFDNDSNRVQKWYDKILHCRKIQKIMDDAKTSVNLHDAFFEKRE